MSLFSFEKVITVSAEDYYEAKWMALDRFYQFIDEGDDYDLAAARFLDDLRPSGGFDEMVMILTLASRFYRFGHDLPRILAEEVEKSVDLYNRQFKKTRRMLGKEQAEDLEMEYKNSISALERYQ